MTSSPSSTLSTQVTATVIVLRCDCVKMLLSPNSAPRKPAYENSTSQKPRPPKTPPPRNSAFQNPHLPKTLPPRSPTPQNHASQKPWPTKFHLPETLPPKPQLPETLPPKNPASQNGPFPTPPIQKRHLPETLPSKLQPMTKIINPDPKAISKLTKEHKKVEKKPEAQGKSSREKAL